MKLLKIILICISVSLFSKDIYAQRVETNQETQKDQFVKAKKIAFFTEKIGLTSEESEIFWPVYNEYWTKKNKIVNERKAKMSYFSKNAKNISADKVEEYADEYIAQELAIAKLLSEYHLKFKEILPIEKVMKIYLADYEFKAYLLFQIRESGRNDEEPLP